MSSGNFESTLNIYKASPAVLSHPPNTRKVSGSNPDENKFFLFFFTQIFCPYTAYCVYILHNKRITRFFTAKMLDNYDLSIHLHKMDIGIDLLSKY